LSNNEVQQPTLQITVNGIVLASVYAVEIQSHAFQGADRFSFAAAIVASEASLYTQVPLDVEVAVTIDGQVGSLLTGQADRIDIDPVRNTVQVSGRDLTAQMIAAQIRESFENQTSSDVATLLASRHGLAAAVSPTTTLIGRYYQDSYTRTAVSQHGRASTEWDLLCWLAQQEGFDVWVDGTTLYFQPQSQAVALLSVTPTDCVHMQLSRAMDIATGFSVEVRSWNCAMQELISESARYQSPPASTNNMITLRPNLSSDAAGQLAQRIANQLSSHERHITFELPMDLATTVRSQLQLAETGTDFDGTYIVCEVTRTFSYHSGFTQHVAARQFPWMTS
jgi:phage protein D